MSLSCIDGHQEASIAITHSKLQCPDRYFFFEYTDQRIRKIIEESGPENIENDIAGRITALIKKLQMEMQNDEVELLLEKRFYNVEHEIADSKIIPGKIKRIRTLVTNADGISIILVC